MRPEDSFHALHVVSDLHLGGEKGFQIFDQGPALAGLIEHLAKGTENAPVALVLNGDVVDFLAEPNARYLDPEGAVGKLQRIIEDPAFAPVWTALRAYVRTSGRYLVLAMGNHDVELALPPVRERLLQALCGEDLAARARLSMVFDGTGYAARVGKARVLCVHGNEVDTWNVVDHEALRRLIQAMKADMPLPAWTPNAGTQLVVDVMNEVKKRHPLVDLLKPETRPVPSVLLALEPALLQRVERAGPVFARFTRDAVRRRMGLLSAESAPPEPTAEASAFVPPRGARPTGAELLEQAQRALDAKLSPLDLVEPPEAEAQLGFMAITSDLVLERDPRESLRKALRDWLLADSTFHYGAEDSTFRQLDARVGEDIDFLIAGHTHLERALRRQRGEGYYFNTGTWARLIELPAELLNDSTRFSPVYDAFRAGTMEALDRYPHLVVRRPTVVSITQQADGTVRGSLGRVEKQDADYAIRSLQHFDVKKR
jgi:UDP-2,3-diacylglucosamine pyrophosphatase LpxH